MPWFNVDDGLAFHRKVIKAGNAAMGLWVRAGSHCAQQLTDGFVDAEMVSSLGTMKQAERLVLAGLWTRADGGFQYHEWSADGRNPTRAEVLARRSRNAERKAKQRAKIQPNYEDPQVRGDRPPGTHTGVTGGVTGGVSDPPPLPSHKEQKEQKKTPSSSLALKRGTRIPEDFTASDSMIDWARNETPLVGQAETENFRDYWTAASGSNATKRDWVAAWRTWMRKAQRDAERYQPRPPTNGFTSQTDANIVAFLGKTGTDNVRQLPRGEA